jgi:hypothetical protein
MPLSRLILIATPVALACWGMQFVAREWGISGVLAFCPGAGGAWGSIRSIWADENPYRIYRGTRFGMLQGFLVFRHT